MVSVCVPHFDFFKLQRNNLTNANILCPVRLGSGGNKLVQLLIRDRNIYVQTIWTLVLFLIEF